MQTVAQTRTEKNLIDAKADHAAKELKEINQRRIENFEAIIKLEKESIKQCIDQDFFDMAQTKIARVKDITEQIIGLQNA